jgi:sulfur carrier protein
MEITVNSVARNVDDGITVADLLGQYGMDPKYVAVERNKELVPRGIHAECNLAEGDSLEIVTLVGGG